MSVKLGKHFQNQVFQLEIERDVDSYTDAYFADPKKSSLHCYSFVDLKLVTFFFEIVTHDTSCVYQLWDKRKVFPKFFLDITKMVVLRALWKFLG